MNKRGINNKHIVYSNTGFKGISIDISKNKMYKVSIGKKHIGYYKDLRMAIVNRLRAENVEWDFKNDFNNDTVVEQYFKEATEKSEIHKNVLLDKGDIDNDIIDSNIERIKKIKHNKKFALEGIFF